MSGGRTTAVLSPVSRGSGAPWAGGRSAHLGSRSPGAGPRPEGAACVPRVRPTQREPGCPASPGACVSPPHLLQDCASSLSVEGLVAAHVPAVFPFPGRGHSTPNESVMRIIIFLFFCLFRSGSSQR